MSLRSRGRRSTALLAFLLVTLLASCTSSARWRAIPEPWTAEVVDAQRRVQVVLTDGTRLELEHPRFEPPQNESGGAVAWTGAGPVERYPQMRIPLAQVRSIEGIETSGPMLTGDRVGEATLVVAGVILWVLILVAIFT